MTHIYWPPLGATLTAYIGFVSLQFVVLRRNVFIPWGICLRGLVPLLRSSIYFCPCVPRVSFRALPSLHPGLCRSIVPTALTVAEYTHSPKCLRVLTETSTAYLPKYLRVLTEISTRTYRSVYAYLRKRVRRTHCSEYVALIVTLTFMKLFVKK